ASVFPLVSTRALARPFTYAVESGVGPGTVVAVRLHGASRRGVVVDVGVPPPDGIEPAPIDRVLDEVPAPPVELALWLADYYGSTPGRALALVAPVKRARRGSRPQPADREALAGEARPAALSPAQQAAVERIVGTIDGDEPGRFLLHGATGSGKTEVY